jgi:hypothetical protein
MASRAQPSRDAQSLKCIKTRGETSMMRRSREAIEWRYNLFRHKWQPDLWRAVPEYYPVPEFITGDQWEYGGTREHAILPPGLNLTEVEDGVRLNSFHRFQTADHSQAVAIPVYSAARMRARVIAKEIRSASR